MVKSGGGYKNIESEALFKTSAKDLDLLDKRLLRRLLKPYPSIREILGTIKTSLRNSRKPKRSFDKWRYP
jgi:hypothetical protein